MQLFIFITLLVASSWCISDELLSDVVKALADGQKIVNLRPVYVAPPTQIETQKANAESKQKQKNADIYQEATKILVMKYGVEVLDQLDGIDFSALLPNPVTIEPQVTVKVPSRKKRYNLPNSTTVNCVNDDTNCQSITNKNYRTVTGVCNNIANRAYGSANSPVQRILGKPNYADGLGTIRKAVSGYELPSTRLISNIINQDSPEVFDGMANHFHMQFGQFVAHDLIFMPSSTGPNGETLDCSICPTSSANCAPISVPADDKYFTPTTSTNLKCMRLTRALNAQKSFGARQQIDQNTHFLDLSSVYGSSGCESAQVRSFSNGKLTVLPALGVDGTNIVTWNLPPINTNDTNCQSKAPLNCFRAGDFRNSLHPGLIPLHVLFIEEHNRIADKLKQLRPSSTDEELYQTTRRILTAVYQLFVYKEYLPKLLGTSMMQEFGLNPLTTGNTAYKPTVNPSLFAEFAAAAFRFGHSQARSDFTRVTPLNVTAASNVNLGSNIFYADAQYDYNGPKQLLSGMLYMSAMSVDTSFSFPIRNQLFEIRNQKASGVDLIAVNLMRGRDVGLHPYVAYRSWAKLPVVTKWDDLLPQMGLTRVNILKKVYADVRDVDLYAGILMELPMSGALIGPTGGRIIAEQFKRLRDGDRFYFEHADATVRGLTAGELAEVRKQSLKGIICRFYGAERILVNKNIFDPTGSFEACNTQPEMTASTFVQKWP